MTTISKAPCPMCGGPRDSEIYVCPKCRYVPVSFSMPTIMSNQFDDAYWIRVFAGQILTNVMKAYNLTPGRVPDPYEEYSKITCNIAESLLGEIKKREAEKK